MTTATDTLTATGRGMGYINDLTLAFHVKDLKASLAWYRDVLGFKLIYHMEDIAWCELSTGVGGVNVGLSQVESPKTGGPTPTFGVSDIDHARKQLEDRGVKFDGPTQEIPNMVKLATFFDPDGNAIMFSQALGNMGG